MAGPIPLLALRAFVAVGRLGSVQDAAGELGVTPGAVSQQVKRLEERMGVVLLERRHRAIRPTPAGDRLLGQISGAFQQIDDAFHAGRAEAAGHAGPRVLTVTTTAVLAASWLVPRLGRFSARHPDVELRIETSPRLVDLRRQTRVDVALRHGLGGYDGLEAAPFLKPQMVPVAAPALLRGGPAIGVPADCLAYPLLQDADRGDWRLWFRAHGVPDDSRARRGASLQEEALLVRAAVAGQGLALVSDFHAAEDIAAGRLVPVLDLPCPTLFAYYFVARPEAMARRPVAQFRRFVFEEAAGMPATAGRGLPDPSVAS